ncbi:T-complex protein 1 theta subunit [Endogone sp. FLAS-F59071]|nr:T-complex protein 1 theta subunit [Endogone sp. FLAS-F59071]|eukprot:RUS14466.1 T-complex protein 1 theta subunit [Endogone sp. FLAS-F59071]
MVINHLEKLFVTNDAATIIRELEVVHPAAKLLVMASQQQEAEIGDATNFVVVFAGELLQKAEYLLRMGLHPSEIVQGYELAREKALEILGDLTIDKVADLKSKEQLIKPVRTAIAAKQFGHEDLLSDLVIEAVLSIMPKNPKDFNVDNVRVVKIMGSSIHESRVVRGMVFGREPEGVVNRAEKAKVGIFTCPLDIAQTETKGTVLIHNAAEMLNFTKGEEVHMEKIFKELADSGVKVVVTGGGVGELALHYLNRLDILVVKVLSKFDLRRLCRVTGATALARLGAPMPEEMGFCDIVETIEIGGDRVTVFRQEDETSRTATIVLRGATSNHLDDIERAIDDGVNVVKAITKDNRLVPGAGATEMELNKRLLAVGERTPGLNQHSIKRFAEALEVIPRTLAENAGLDATEVLSKLYAAHYKEENGGVAIGVDIENEADGTQDAVKAGIYDVLTAKYWGIKYATDAALTILQVDQIIMSKPAGGPKQPKNQQNWDED